MAVEDIVRKLTPENRIHLGAFLDGLNPENLCVTLYTEVACVHEKDYFFAELGKMKPRYKKLATLFFPEEVDRARGILCNTTDVSVDPRGRIKISEEAAQKLPANSFLVYREGNVVFLEYQTDKPDNNSCDNGNN
jgi:hypothetical protein